MPWTFRVVLSNACISAIQATPPSAPASLPEAAAAGHNPAGDGGAQDGFWNQFLDCPLPTLPSEGASAACWRGYLHFSLDGMERTIPLQLQRTAARSPTTPSPVSSLLHSFASSLLTTDDPVQRARVSSWADYAAVASADLSFPYAIDATTTTELAESLSRRQASVHVLLRPSATAGDGDAAEGRRDSVAAAPVSPPSEQAASLANARDGDVVVVASATVSLLDLAVSQNDRYFFNILACPGSKDGSESIVLADTDDAASRELARRRTQLCGQVAVTLRIDEQRQVRVQPRLARLVGEWPHKAYHLRYGWCPNDRLTVRSQEQRAQASGSRETSPSRPSAFAQGEVSLAGDGQRSLTFGANQLPALSLTCTKAALLHQRMYFEVTAQARDGPSGLAVVAAKGELALARLLVAAQDSSEVEVAFTVSCIAAEGMAAAGAAATQTPITIDGVLLLADLPVVRHALKSVAAHIRHAEEERRQKALVAELSAAPQHAAIAPVLSLASPRSPYTHKANADAHRTRTGAGVVTPRSTNRSAAVSDDGDGWERPVTPPQSLCGAAERSLLSQAPLNSLSLGALPFPFTVMAPSPTSPSLRDRKATTTVAPAPAATAAGAMSPPPREPVAEHAAVSVPGAKAEETPADGTGEQRPKKPSSGSTVHIPFPQALAHAASERRSSGASVAAALATATPSAQTAPGTRERNSGTAPLVPHTVGVESTVSTALETFGTISPGEPSVSMAPRATPAAPSALQVRQPAALHALFSASGAQVAAAPSSSITLVNDRNAHLGRAATAEAAYRGVSEPSARERTDIFGSSAVDSPGLHSRTVRPTDCNVMAAQSDPAPGQPAPEEGSQAEAPGLMVSLLELGGAGGHGEEAARRSNDEASRSGAGGDAASHERDGRGNTPAVSLGVAAGARGRSVPAESADGSGAQHPSRGTALTGRGHDRETAAGQDGAAQERLATQLAPLSLSTTHHSSVRGGGEDGRSSQGTHTRWVDPELVLHFKSASSNSEGDLNAWSRTSEAQAAVHNNNAQQQQQQLSLPDASHPASKAPSTLYGSGHGGNQPLTSLSSAPPPSLQFRQPHPPPKPLTVWNGGRRVAPTAETERNYGTALQLSTKHRVLLDVYECKMARLGTAEARLRGVLESPSGAVRTATQGGGSGSTAPAKKRADDGEEESALGVSVDMLRRAQRDKDAAERRRADLAARADALRARLNALQESRRTVEAQLRSRDEALAASEVELRRLGEQLRRECEELQRLPSPPTTSGRRGSSARWRDASAAVDPAAAATQHAETPVEREADSRALVLWGTEEPARPTAIRGTEGVTVPSSEGGESQPRALHPPSKPHRRLFTPSFPPQRHPIAPRGYESPQRHAGEEEEGALSVSPFPGEYKEQQSGALHGTGVAPERPQSSVARLRRNTPVISPSPSQHPTRSLDERGGQGGTPPWRMRPPPPSQPPSSWAASHLAEEPPSVSPLTRLELAALLDGIDKGDRSLVLHLLHTKPSLFHASNNLLHVACAAKLPDVVVVETLLRVRPELTQGIDANTGNTVLHVACAARYPSEEIVRRLIVAGVPTQHRNSSGMSAFHVAVLNGADLARNRVKDALLTLGDCSVDDRTADGRTPLHLVCHSDRNVAIVNYLLARGADVMADAQCSDPVSGQTLTVTPLELSRLSRAAQVAACIERAYAERETHSEEEEEE